MTNLNKPKIDVEKVMADFYQEAEKTKNLQPEDLDITSEEAKELLKKFEALEAYALKVKADVCKK